VKTALIADIHGNLVALEAVLADVERRKADRIVCLGDVAATGPQPRETIERIAELGCPVVQGDSDAWLVSPPGDEPAEDEDTQRIVDIDRWVRDQLGPDHLEQLAGYRPVVELEELLGYHGSPLSNDDSILPGTPEPELARMLRGHDAAVMAGGHTHVVMMRPFGRSIVMNPGSVGLPFEHIGDGRFRNPPWAEYAMVSHGRVEFRRVPIDVRAVTSAALESGMPHGGWWVKDWAWS
jgi:predicted phosphodiesterase